jgi:hypothetical protein
MQQLAVLIPLLLALFALLSVLAWFVPRLTVGVLLTVTAIVVAVTTSVELEAAGLSEAYAYVAGFALAQPALMVLATLPGHVDSGAYWQPGRLPTIALDLSLGVVVGAMLGSLAVLALSQLGLLAGDRGTAALTAVSLGAVLTYLYRTRRFRTDTADNSLTAV